MYKCDGKISTFAHFVSKNVDLMGKNVHFSIEVILTHPLGKELYSYEALLIDQCSVKLGVKNCVQLIAKNTNFSDVKFTEKYNILHEIEAIISSQIVKIS